MPWSTGTFTLVYDWVARRDAGSPTNKIGATEMMVQEQDLADGLEACIKHNGDIAATANLPMGGFLHTNVGAATARTNYTRVAELQDSSHTWIAGGGTADAITATYAPALSALTNGCLVGFRASAANATTTPTFAPNGLTAKTIVKGANTALNVGDIPGQYAECFVRYNSTTDKWHLLNPYGAQVSSIQTSSYTWIDGGGTADAITATYVPALTALTNGTLVGVRATAANATTTPTFAPNGLTAKTIVKNANAAVVAGDIAGDGHELLLRYASDIDKWVLLNPIYPNTTINLSSLTTDNTLGDVADGFVGTDASESDASNKTTVGQALYNAINTATADTAPDMSADHVLTRDDSASGVKKVLARYIGAGKQTVWIPAGAMVARTTNGAASGTTESTTNKVMNKTLDFDTTTQEFAQFAIAFPKGWNGGTVTFVPYWTAASGSGGVVWGLAGVALSNDDAIDTAFGTAQTSTDTLITALDVHEGPESSAITIAGTPATGDVTYFQVNRTVSDGSDTLGVDAKLIGIKLIYTIDSNVDD